MSSIKKINKQLNALYGGQVFAEEKRGCAVVDGTLDKWEDVLKACNIAVDKKRYLGVVNNINFTGAEIPPMKTPKFSDKRLEGKKCDVLVVGAGIIGCAVARELMRSKLDVLLIDKEHDVAMQASCRNDGMIHPGVDLKKAQLKQAYNLRGNLMYDEVCTQLDVDYRKDGQYLCFDSSAMKPLLHLILPHWRNMGVPVSYVGEKELRALQPNLRKDICCALYFPTAGMVSPYALTIAYAENAVDNGAEISFDTAAVGMELSGNNITAVYTNRGTIYPKVVVNAAGVFSDELAQMANDRFFSIHPRRGTNSILDKKAYSKAGMIVSSFGSSAVKSAHSKGGGIVTTIDGNLLIGPDAVETYERENFATSRQSVSGSIQKHRATVPAISEGDIITYFTGVRAATFEEDFVITKGKFTKNIVHAAGIQSPGLTAAPAIAVDVAKMAEELLSKQMEVKANESFDPIRKRIPSPSSMSDEQRDSLIKQEPDYGVVVCRCEQISRGEITAALNRSVPCDTLDGVKRRVRAGMGRCQGGFCGPIVAQIISEEKNIPIDKVLKNTLGSQLLVSDTKEGLK